jgi:RNA polymerase sigma-70 factor, ECF subfamily
MNKEDIKLVANAKQDPKEYEKLYAKYSDKVFNYFWYRTGHDRSLSEDLMQETFLRAFRHLKRFNNREYSYLTYLIAIAHNVLIDHYRKPKTVPFEAVRDVPYEITEDLDRKSYAEVLWKAIQYLPQSQRDKLLMKYQQNMSIKDIATATGTTENAVKLSLSRIRKKLRSHPYLKDIAGFADTKRKQTKAKFLGKK